MEEKNLKGFQWFKKLETCTRNSDAYRMESLRESCDHAWMPYPIRYTNNPNPKRVSGSTSYISDSELASSHPSLQPLFSLSFFLPSNPSPLFLFPNHPLSRPPLVTRRVSLRYVTKKIPNLGQFLLENTNVFPRERERERGVFCSKERESLPRCDQFLCTLTRVFRPP